MVQVIVQHKVKNYDAWLPKFDAHEATRRKFGCLGSTVHRTLAEGNDVVMVFQWTSADDFKLFTEKSDLREVMAGAGVIGAPTIQVLTDTVAGHGAAATEAKNRQTVERYIKEVFEKGNHALVDELYAPDFKNTTAPPGLPAGPAGVKALLGAFRGAFPDARATIRDIVAKDDTVTWHIEVNATHKGDLMGIPASGRRASWRAMSVDRLKNGQITERWEVFDMHGLLQQIGPAK